MKAKKTLLQREGSFVRDPSHSCDCPRIRDCGAVRYGWMFHGSEESYEKWGGNTKPKSGRKRNGDAARNQQRAGKSHRVGIVGHLLPTTLDDPNLVTNWYQRLKEGGATDTNDNTVSTPQAKSIWWVTKPFFPQILCLTKRSGLYWMNRRNLNYKEKTKKHLCREKNRLHASTYPRH